MTAPDAYLQQFLDATRARRRDTCIVAIATQRERDRRRSSSFHTTSLVPGLVDFRIAGRDQQSGSAMRRLVLVQLDGDIEVAPDFGKGLVEQDPNGRPAGPLGVCRALACGASGVRHRRAPEHRE